MIKNSVGTNMFRNLYLNIDNKKVDVAQDGHFSCAFFVSNILLIWGLISEGHATVEATTKDMIKNGWKRLAPSHEGVKPGDVIVWERNSENHFHNGFYIGNKKAISNNAEKKAPIVHSWDYEGKRKIIAIYTWPKF
jgi:hypothetical protein